MGSVIITWMASQSQLHQGPPFDASNIPTWVVCSCCRLLILSVVAVVFDACWCWSVLVARWTCFATVQEPSRSFASTIFFGIASPPNATHCKEETLTAAHVLIISRCRVTILVTFLSSITIRRELVGETTSLVYLHIPTQPWNFGHKFGNSANPLWQNLYATASLHTCYDGFPLPTVPTKG